MFLYYFLFSSINAFDIEDLRSLRLERAPQEMKCLKSSMYVARRKQSSICNVNIDIPGMTSSQHSYLIIPRNNLSIYESSKRFFKWKIIAKDSINVSRSSGGDNFIVLVYNESFRSSGEVFDLKNGAYEVKVPVPSPGIYRVEAILALSLTKEAVKCQESILDGCEFQKTLHGVDAHLVKNCVWQSINIIDDGERVQQDISLKVKEASGMFHKTVPKCTVWDEISNGRWMSYHNRSTCPEDLCNGSLKGILEYKLPNMIWVPWNCKLHMIQSDKPDIQNCFKKVKHITVIGDSVGIKGYASDFEIFLPKGIGVNSIKLKGILSKKILRQKIFQFPSSVLVIAVGRHEFLHGNIKKHIKELKSCIPMLKKIIKRTRIVWVLPAAPRRSLSDTSCQRFVWQRWDRILSYIQETKSVLETVAEIEIVDTFNITSSAHPSWYRDNIHMHSKTALSRVVSQVILNKICLKYL